MGKKFQLKASVALNDTSRNASVDVFRALAILSVVCFHFKRGLNFGYLGVDLFFVISGLLIGGLLVKNLTEGRQINFFRFVLQRGFKIWPSYYAYILLGSFLSAALYSKIHPVHIIPLNDYARYLFFYLNYTGDAAWSFAHLWSICVEEHFYIMLPLLYILIQRFFAQKIYLFATVILAIVAGIIFKYLSWTYTKSQDVISGTHNRIDALAWGVLLSLILAFYPHLLRPKITRVAMLCAGVVIFIITLILRSKSPSDLYIAVAFHSLVPFSFFLMIAGTYFAKFNYIKALRFVAYYSYNWYLWHQLWGYAVIYHFGNSYLGFFVFISITFLSALVFTILIEEPFLAIRSLVIKKLFGASKDASKIT